MPSNPKQKPPLFSVRIVCTDHYMAEPVPGLDMVYSEFRRTPIYRVPCIRVFGPTMNGQKTCMNIHGVFPYLYAVYDGTLPPGQYLQQFASSLDKAINISRGKASSPIQHVYKVSLVSGIPFYGYHSEEQPFLKIYLYNPLMIKKVADLLLAGVVMNRIIQPHESHMPYTLQMFMDYNLFGMNLLNAAAVKIRQPLPPNCSQAADFDPDGKSGVQTPSILLEDSSLEMSGRCSTRLWTSANIHEDVVLPSDVKKQSTCELEVDVVAADILNRLEVDQGMIGENPGLAALWEDEKQRRSNRQISMELGPPPSPDRGATDWTTNEFQLQQRLQDILQSLEPFISDESMLSRNPSLDSTLIQGASATQSPQVVCDLAPGAKEASTTQVSSSSQKSTKTTSVPVDISQMLNTSLDLSLVNILAALADSFGLDGSPHHETSSSGNISVHQILSQVTSLEDRDSLLSQVILTNESVAEIQAEETLESIEMSQTLEGEMDFEYERWKQSFEDDDLIAMINEHDSNSLPSLVLSQTVSSQNKEERQEEDGDDNDDDVDDDDDVLAQLDGPVGLRKKGLSKLTAAASEPSVKTPGNKLSINDFKNTNISINETLLTMPTSNESNFTSVHSSSPDSDNLNDLSNEDPVCSNNNIVGASSCRNVDDQKNPRRLERCLTERSNSVAFDEELEASSKAFRKSRISYTVGKRKPDGERDHTSSSRKLSGKALRSGNSDNECVLDSSALVTTLTRDDSGPRCGRVLRSKRVRCTSTVALNTRKRFKMAGDQVQLDKFKDVIKEVRVVVEKLDLRSASSVHLSGVGTEDAKCFDSYSSKKFTTSNSNPSRNKSDAMIIPEADSSTDEIENVAQTTTSTSTSIVTSRRYADDVDDDECSVEYTDVLSKFALLSSPETSDLENEGPTPTSPTQVRHRRQSDEALASGGDLDLTDTIVQLPSDEIEDCPIVAAVVDALSKRSSGASSSEMSTTVPVSSVNIADAESISSELGVFSVDLFSESSEGSSKPDAVEIRNADSEVNLSRDKSKPVSRVDSAASFEVRRNQLSTKPLQFGLAETRLVAVRPLVDPPSRTHVWNDMLSDSFPLKKPGDAFYSDPGDVPVRLRIGESAFQYKVKSPLVSDLPEHEFDRGLRYWQEEAMAGELTEFGHSQMTKDDILRQFSALPSLCNILIKDKEVTVTPCRSPPRPSVVRDWLKAREKIGKEEKVGKEEDPTVVPREKSATAVSAKPLPRSVDTGDFHLNERAEEETTNAPSSLLNKCNVQNFRLSFSRQDEGMNSKQANRSTSKDVSLMSENSITQTSRSMGIPKASFIELEIPCVSREDDGKDDRNSGEEHVMNETRDSNVESTGSQSKMFADLPDSGDRLADVVASTPVHSSRPENERLKSLEQDLLKCTPIQNVPQNFDTESVPSSVVNASDVVSEVKPGDGEGTPLSTKPRQLLTNSEAKRRASSFRRTLPLHHMGCESASSTMKNRSQIEGPTLGNTFGFKVDSQNVHEAKALHDYQYLTVLSTELHVATRGDLLPDPECDEIRAIFYCVHYDRPPRNGIASGFHSYVILVDKTDVLCNGQSRQQQLLHRSGLSDVDVTYVATEDQLLTTFVEVVKRCDADVLVGYEVQRSSWGYILQRAAHLDRDLCSQLSRVPGGSLENHFEADKDEYGAHHMSEIHIAGRIVLNLWRLARHEVTLNVYSFENVAYHVLHQRFPRYSFRCLTEWFDHRSHLYRWRTVENFVIRSRANLQLIEKLDLIGQTSEFARIYGIEFYDVLSRGSQYRVESMMLRMAKPQNFIAVSPSVQQRARMRAPECIPLNLEPKSEFYTHPVVVLDFQSLYPSIMIAYNYCFSTCLGRIDNFPKLRDGPVEFGCTSLRITPKLLQSLANDVSICPNGVVFVKQHVRRGVMSRMVEDILNARLMVKRSMKEYKKDKSLQRLLHARQLGLKLIANVTFGYAAANFSGRMPCVEVGDSILRKSRETLERAIHLVEGTPKWSAKVIYGDTDSMFILLHGRTKEEAFAIGQEIADAVTADNPKPVKLRFEKVYLPCVLQTKKRYVGFMYESVDQAEPTFDAKGIETVRRDNCGAVSKILEKSIKILFSTHNVSMVKKYVQRQFVKIMEGRNSLQDFIFAKEFRGLTGYQPGACVPALEIAKRSVSKDRRAEPLVGERVPYVIVFGIPGQPLIQLVRQPHEVLDDPSLRLNTVYYITKQILPPLSRVFSLLGVSVPTWYQELPRVLKSVPVFDDLQETTKKGTISRYFMSLNCPVCDDVTNSGICAECKDDQQRTALILGTRIRAAERGHSQVSQLCVSCMGCIDPQLPCVSLDCPVFFRLVRSSRELSAVPQLQTLQLQLLRF